MKKLTYLLILFGLSICIFSCVEESQSTNSINKRAKLTKNTPKVNRNSNWKKMVGLTQDQLTEINKITARIDKKRVKIPVVNGKQDPTQLRVLEDYKNKKINEVLSPTQRKKRTQIELAIANQGKVKKTSAKKAAAKKKAAKKAAAKKRAAKIAANKKKAKVNTKKKAKTATQKATANKKVKTTAKKKKAATSVAARQAANRKAKIAARKKARIAARKAALKKK